MVFYILLGDFPGAAPRIFYQLGRYDHAIIVDNPGAMTGKDASCLMTGHRYSDIAKHF